MSLGSNIDTLEIKNADKIKFIGTSNTVVDTTTGRIGIGTDTPEDALHVNGGIRFGGHIIPLNNAVFDVGSAENKIRDMYVDTNSLWIGDTTKIAFSGGKMKFKKRKVDKVPTMLLALAIGHNPAKDESAVEVDAVSFAKTIDPTITTISDLKLQHWRDFTKTFDASKSISDIFEDNDEDYEAITASEAFMEVGSNIFTEHSLSIGKSTDPTSALDVVGDINLTGSLLINGVAQTFGGGVALETSITDIWSNLASNVTRIVSLETSNTDIWSNLASNVTRIASLETSNTDIWSNLASNVTRIASLETSNADIWSNLASNVTRIASLETSNADIWSNLASNVTRIASLETSNADIWSNLASNVTRVVSLETSNADIWSNLASNVTRVVSLETSNADIWSNLASNVTRIVSLETSNADIWSNLASNVTRIVSLETSNTDIWSNLASNVTRIVSLETSNADIWSNLASNVTRVVSLETSNTDIWSNLASNVTRVVSLETSNVDIWSNLASNVTRVVSLETSNVDIWSNLASNVTRIVSLETDLASNALKLNTLTLDDVVNISNITSNTIEITNTTTGLVTTANVSVGRDLTVSGNLTVLGTTTTVDTDNLRVQDPIIEIGKDNTASPPIVDLGIVMTRPSGFSNVGIIFDESTDTLEIGYTQGSASDSTITMETATANPISLNVNGNAYVTSNLEVGTTNLFVDTTTGRVGIGTNTPNAALQLIPGITTVSDISSPTAEWGSILEPSWFDDLNNGNSNHCIVKGVAVDSSGNVYVNGEYKADSIWNIGNSVTLPTVTSGDQNQNFIIKYNSTGTPQWGKTTAGPPNYAAPYQSIGEGTGIVTDSSGNVYATGRYRDSSTLNLGNSVTLPSSSSLIAYIVKYDPDGTVQWANVIPTTSADSRGESIAVDSDGNVYVTGNYKTSSGSIGVSLGNSVTLPPSTIYWAYIVKYDTDGVAQWAEHIPATGNSDGLSIATDSSGNVYTTGHYKNLSTVVTLGNSVTLPASTDLIPDAYIVKYDTDGVAQWAVNIPSIDSSGQGISTDSSGNVYVTGYYDASSSIDLGNSVTLPAVSTNSIFIIKYNTGGTPQWAKSINTTSASSGLSIATDSSGNVFLTGYYRSASSVSLGNGINLPISSSPTSTDGFIIIYDTDGIAQGVRVNNTGGEKINTIAISLNGDIVIGGDLENFIGPLSLGNGITLSRTTNSYVENTLGLVIQYSTETSTTDTALTVGGNMEVGVANLFVNTSLSRVGIGTTTPEAELHVEGNVYMSSNLEVGRTTISTTGFDDVPTVSWARSIGGTSSDTGQGIATDSNGNVYVIGYYRGSVIIGSTTLNSADSDDVFVAKYDTSGTVQWAKSISGTSTDYGYDIATDSNGNVYVTGRYFDSVTIGSTTLTSAGLYDAFVAKYDTSGTAQWALGIGGGNNDSGYSIATDSGGNVYVTGNYFDSVTIGSTTLTSAGSTDIFVAKYDTSGTAQWARSIGGTSSDTGEGIATDSNGNVYVTGMYFDSVTIGSTTLTSTGSSDAFVAKYDTSGTVQWARSIGGTSSDTGRSIATDSNGNVYVTGYYYGSVTIGSTTLNSLYSYDAFVVKYDTSGTVQWAKSIGGTNSDYGYGIATDSSGNVYVIGKYSGSFTIGSTTLTSAGSNDVFVAKYDTSGTVQWATSIGGTGNDSGGAIATDSNGNVYVAGYYAGSVTIGTTTLNSLGSVDVFVVKYSPPSILHINTGLEVSGDVNFTGSLTQNGSTFGSSPWVTSGSDISYTSGNVGIGTNSPQGTLHVSSGTAGDCRLILQADTDNNNEDDNPRIEFWQDGSIQESAIGMTSNRLNLWNSVGSGGIAFHTNTVDGYINAIERMTITSTGEVGIGATVPARLFHVNGTSRFEGEVEWYKAGQSTSHANFGANRDWYIRSGVAGGKVVIQDASTASYVGIGTSSPGYKLDVNGDINLTGSLRIGGVAQTFGGGGGSGGEWVIVNTNEIHYSLGNVGIGLSNPNYPLHVSGDIYATGNVTAYSDKRKKTNLRIIEDSVKKLEQINGYTYDKDGTEYTGLIAQEVLHILPQAVVGSEEEGYGLAYGNMVGILVEAIKELSNEVKILKEKLSV